MTRREALQRTALLLGISLSPSAINRPLPQLARDPALGPQHLSAARFATASAMAEALLPRTDTPGAIDAGVPAFLDVAYGLFMNDEQRSQLDELFDHAAAQGFADAPLADQQQRLRELGTEASAWRPAMREFRNTAMLAYFTSERVSKEMLNYDPIPGRLDADIPLAEVGGRAWAD